MKRGSSRLVCDYAGRAVAYARIFWLRGGFRRPVNAIRALAVARVAVSPSIRALCALLAGEQPVNLL